MICRLALGMDLRDEQMFEACWAPEFDMTVPPLYGDAVPLTGHLKSTEHAKNVIAGLSEFKSTHHVLTNHLIEVDGERATCSVYMIGTHTLADIETGDRINTIGARYDFECRRFPTGWKITKLVWTRHWSTGNSGLWDIVERRVKEKKAAQ